MENPIIFTAEIIGTIAFASSGAMLGIRKNLDLFGVLVLGLCVAVGGGIVPGYYPGADAAGSIPGSGLCAGGAGNFRSFIFTCLWKAGDHDEPLSDDL